MIADPAQCPALADLEAHRAREARALQAAWLERARAHELLTVAGIDAGTLPERIADLLGELFEARALLRAVVRATPPTADASRTETTP